MPGINPQRPATIYFVGHDGDKVLTRGGDLYDNIIEGEVRYWLGKSPGLYINDYDRIYAVEHIHQVDLTHCIQAFHDELRESEERSRQDRDRTEYERLKRKFENQ